MKRNVSLGEIAKRVGVSTMSVSRALSNSAKVSEERRREILRVAEEMGYRPNPRLSRLMQEMRMTRLRGESPVLGVVNTFGDDRALNKESGPHLYAFLKGVRKRAGDLGFRVDVFSIGSPPMKESRLEQILLTRNVEGILLFPFPYDRETLDIDFSQFPVAALGRSQARQNFHRASPNYFHAVEMAFARALELGHRRIGALLTDIIDLRSGGRYSAAYLQIQERHPELPDLPILHVKDLSESEIHEWISKYRPEVIFGMGAKTYERLLAMGYRVPEDFSYVGLELPLPQDLISGVNSNHSLVAEAGVDLVINQINAHERGLPRFPKTVLIDGYWAEGRTLHRPSSAPAGKRCRARKASSGRARP